MAKKITKRGKYKSLDDLKKRFFPAMYAEEIRKAKGEPRAMAAELANDFAKQLQHVLN